MVFVKLLGILALVAGLALTCLILPAAVTRRMTATGSKYSAFPLCGVSAVLGLCLIGYMVMKNTFWGFVFAWSSVYLLVCWLLTMVLFFVGRRRYGKRYFVRYPKSIPHLLCCVALLVLLVGVITTDRAAERFPEVDEIEAIWFGYAPLTPMNDEKNLSAEYAVLHPETLCRDVERYTGLELPEEEAPSVLGNLLSIASGVRSDADSIVEVLAYCRELNHSFFQQKFSRSFRTTGEKTENPYFYLVIRCTDGKCITRRYAYGSHSPEWAEAEAEAEASSAAEEGLARVQAEVAYKTPQVDEVSVRYRSGGTGGEQLLHYAEYERLFSQLELDSLSPSTQEGMPSVNRMWVCVVRSFPLPPVYSAFGLKPRQERTFYDVSRSDAHTWSYLTALLEIS